MSPQANTTLRTILSLAFLAAAAAHLAWLTPANALAIFVSVTGILGGILALSNLFHVPARVVAFVQQALLFANDVKGDLPATADTPAGTSLGLAKKRDDVKASARKIIGATILLLLVGALAGTQSACNASAAQINTTIEDGVKVGTCIVSQVLGGNVTPVGLIAACSGATEQLIIDAIDDFEAAPPTDAGPVASDLAVAVSAQQKVWLDTAKQNAITSLGSKRSGR